MGRNQLIAPVRPAADIAFRRIHQSGILVDLHGNDIYELNDTGARTWELLRDTSDLEVVVDRLCDEYGGERVEIAAGVAALVDEFRAHRLLVP